MLRVAVVVVSALVAWLVAGWSSGFTLSGPLPSGGYEGTPATLVIPPTVFVVTFVLCVIGGNLAVNAYFRSRRLRR